MQQRYEITLEIQRRTHSLVDHPPHVRAWRVQADSFEAARQRAKSFANNQGFNVLRVVNWRKIGI